MNINRPKFFIHGNGLNSESAPAGFMAVDMPGHNKSLWDESKYSFDAITDYYEEIVPENAIVWGHSLGGHIALNLGLRRKDISVICFGMILLNGPEDIGTLMTPIPEFIDFQKIDRNEEEVEAFLNYSACGEGKVLELLKRTVLEQDPRFNEVLLSTGLESYDWNEVEKAKSLGERFQLVLSKNEKVYNYDLAVDLDVPMILDDYIGHSPWLQDAHWIEQIENKMFISSLKINELRALNCAGNEANKSI